MLSRHAEGMFWIGRYVERAADLARMLDVAYNRQLEGTPDSASQVWRDLLSALYLEDQFHAASGDDVSTAAVNRFLVFAADNPSSIAVSVREARTNVMNMRDVVPHELLETVNQLHGLFTRGELRRAEPHQIYEAVAGHCRAVSGAIADAMARGDEYRFVMLGRMLERAEMTARMIDVNRSSADLATWMSVLRSVSGFHAFIRSHGPLAPVDDVVGFLLAEVSFPFSVRHCLAAAAVQLQGAAGARTWKSPRLLGRVSADLEYAEIPPAGSDELAALIGSLEEGIRAVSATLHADLYRFGGDPWLHSFEAV